MTKPGPKKGSVRIKDGLTRSQRYYRGHKAEAKEKLRQFKILNPSYRGPKQQAKIDYIRRIRETTPCTDCKRFYPYCVMDFDHVRGQKLFNVGTMIGQSLELIDAEIAKCEIVCSNCHRIRTKQRLDHLRREARDKGENFRAYAKLQNDSSINIE